MLSLDYLNKFLVTCKHKNITTASNELFITQPALSKSIMEMEKLLGTQLFIRTSRGLELTPTAEYLRNNTELQMMQIQNTINSIEKTNKIIDKLVIGTSVTIAKNFLTKKLSKFIDMFPKINLNIKNVSINHKENNAIDLITNNEIDLIIANQPIDIKNYTCIPVHTLHDCFVGGKKYKALSFHKIDLKELKKFPLVTNAKNSVTRQSFENFCSQNGISFTPSIEVENNALLSEMIKLNLGIGYTTKEFVMEEIQGKELFIINVNQKLPERHLYVIYKNETFNIQIQTLIDIIQE